MPVPAEVLRCGVVLGPLPDQDQGRAKLGLALAVDEENDTEVLGAATPGTVEKECGAPPPVTGDWVLREEDRGRPQPGLEEEDSVPPNRAPCPASDSPHEDSWWGQLLRCCPAVSGESSIGANAGGAG